MENNYIKDDDLVQMVTTPESEQRTSPRPSVYMDERRFQDLTEKLEERGRIGYRDVAVFSGSRQEGTTRIIEPLATYQADTPYEALEIGPIALSAKERLNKEDRIACLATWAVTEEQLAQAISSFGLYLCHDIKRQSGELDSSKHWRMFRKHPTTGKVEQIPLHLSTRYS